MKKVFAVAITLTFGFVLTVNAYAAGDAKKGKARYAVCMACHGADGMGNKVLNAPKIAGQESWYLERQLKNFKAGIRGADPKDKYGMQMRPMALARVKAMGRICMPYLSFGSAPRIPALKFFSCRTRYHDS